VRQNEPNPTDTDTDTERVADLVSGAGATGQVSWVLTGPDGEVKESGTAHNTITTIGDQRLSEAAALASPTVLIPNGAKLGTGATAASKTGAGAFLGSYLPDSHVGFQGTPASGPNGALRQIRFTIVWAAGRATTASQITEAVIVNDYAAGTNATSTAANTLSRVILTPAVGSKGAQDALTLIWDWNIGT
jgi:hypothetical protein